MINKREIVAMNKIKDKIGFKYFLVEFGSNWGCSSPVRKEIYVPFIKKKKQTKKPTIMKYQLFLRFRDKFLIFFNIS